jgi:hypothetical protein
VWGSDRWQQQTSATIDDAYSQVAEAYDDNYRRHLEDRDRFITGNLIRGRVFPEVPT